ncbi:hypothetical protein ACNOYE_31720 [Nannocystaceae bacterium ST9]
MLVRLRGVLGEFELRPRRLAEAAGLQPLDLDPSLVVRLLWAGLADQPDYRLRALLLDTDDPGGRLDEAGLVDRLARLVARGDLILVREVHAGISPSDPDHPDEPDEPDIIERLDWIEVLIEDEDHNPVPNVAYELLLPDGSTRIGKTNKLGIVRYDRIPSGSCKFKLTEMDAASWKQV